jgi:hypothetical protein
MMKKAEIIEVCIQTAAQFTGWEYSAGAFKNKEASPCIKVVHPFWSFSPRHCAFTTENRLST